MRIRVAIVTMLVVAITVPSAEAQRPTPLRNGRIVFWSLDEGYNLYSMESDGSDIKKITDFSDQDIHGLDSSPDGHRIAFALGDDSEIYTVDPNGRHLSRLTNNRFMEAWPTWSPDGRRIAFVRVVRNLAQIYVMRSDGRGKARRITNVNQSIYPLEWSPTGKRLAFGMGPALYSITPAGTKLKKLVDEVLPLGQLSYSPDGRHLLYSNAIKTFFDPAWYRICYPPKPQPVSRPFGVRCHADLYVVDSDGGTPKQVTSDLGIEAFPSWSPDGEQIVFLSDRVNRAWVYDIYMMNPDGSGQEMIARRPSGALATAWLAKQP